MMNLKAIALATALTLSAGSMTFAVDGISATSALSSATTLSFQTVPAGDEAAVLAGTGLASEQVDLDSLKAALQANPKFLAQLESYGASIDDVIGISATDETDVTILVRG
ncbi:hypothetical protein [Devosia sp. CN2-171]|uniref:hypothetical protein n=1 Tax=Devosia sp. CN2-171 TaxID=3400909 RepID=UPI003BF85F66